MVPGQPPLSRWMAQMETSGSQWARANRATCLASPQVGHLGLLRVVVDAGQQRDALQGPQPRLAEPGIEPPELAVRAVQGLDRRRAHLDAGLAGLDVVVEGHDVHA